MSQRSAGSCTRCTRSNSFTAVWMNCSSNLKNSESFSRSLKHFFLSVSQNNFGNKISYLAGFWCLLVDCIQNTSPQIQKIRLVLTDMLTQVSSVQLKKLFYQRRAFLFSLISMQTRENFFQIVFDLNNRGTLLITRVFTISVALAKPKKISSIVFW